MNHYYFGKKSQGNLIKVCPQLDDVAHRALELSKVDFAIIEGARTKDRQFELFKSGDTWTLNSRHIILPNQEFCYAIDLAAYINGEISWEPILYDKIAKAWFRAAIELDTQIEWGGFWESNDMVHWQLSRKEFP